MKPAIWLFAGGPMQVGCAKKILERGYKLIVTDRDPNCACAKYADRLVELDTFDVGGNMAMRDILKNECNIKAVMTVAADCHYTVAKVARWAGLHGIKPEISYSCRKKPMLRTMLRDAGLPQPKFLLANTVQEVNSFIRETPSVIKATDNSGSRGFKVVGNNPITQEEFDYTAGLGTMQAVLVEEQLESLSEQSVETLWYNGTMHWLNWVDREIVDGIERGHTNPSAKNGKYLNKIRSQMIDAGLALTMDKLKGGHFLKGDIMETKHGPIILELTPRLSGGWDSSYSTPARGADFQGGAIELALGRPLDMKYFTFTNPKKTVMVRAEIPEGVKDNLGRKFYTEDGHDISLEYGS